MHSLRKYLPNSFCCFGLDAPDDTHPSASLDNLQRPTSTISVALPHHTVPHSSSESNSNDAQALRHIFSSSSSVRGYQTAATTPGCHPVRGSSFDTNFQFGSSSPTKALPSRIEQIGHHIKQKLSESRLSKSSSKNNFNSDVGENEQLRMVPTHSQASDTLAISQRSTGLIDLLMSRTASDGGYDSDAMSVKTPVLHSNAGTIKVSPKVVLNDAHQCSMTSQNETALTESNKQSRVDDADVRIPADHGRLRSSPPLSAPSNQALQAGGNGSPTNALRRPTTDVENETIQLSETSGSRALHAPSITQADTERGLSGPKQSSSLEKGDDSIPKELKRLNGQIETSKANSPTEAGDEVRTSLVADLDPALLAYLSKQTDRPLNEEHEHTKYEFLPPEQAAQPLSSPKRKESLNLNEIATTNQSTFDLQSLAETDRESIHLFNMRISQRLASNSMLPVLSPTSSRYPSTKSLINGDVQHSITQSQVSIPRYPSWIAVEHNRLPSDPDTRRIFESVKLESQSNGKRKSHDTAMVQATGRKRLQGSNSDTRDDTSSYYWSDGEVDKNHAISSLDVPRQKALNNPNSIAIGGRSVSVGLPTRTATNSIGQLSAAGENAWFRGELAEDRKSSVDSWEGTKIASQRLRSVSTPHKPLDGTDESPTPKPKSYFRSTDRNENLSMISADQAHIRRNENMSAISPLAIQGKEAEHFGEFDPKSLYSQSSGSISRRENAGWLCQGKRSGYGFDFVHSSSDKRNSEKKLNGHDTLGRPSSYTTDRECVDEIWERAFQRAIDFPSESSIGGFLTAPRFDHHGKRKQNRASLSDVAGIKDTRSRSRSPHHGRRSRSADGSTHNAWWYGEGADQNACFDANDKISPRIIVVDTDQQTSTDQADRRYPWVRNKTRSNGRTSSLPWTTDEEVRKHGTSTPIRDFLESWARFPSLTRDARNGAAGELDGVVTKDFESSSPKHFTFERDNPFTITTGRSISNLGVQPMTSWKQFSSNMHKGLDRARSKSMTLRSKVSISTISPAERARQQRSGLTGKWRKLYTSRSTYLRRYAMMLGHRSSIGTEEAAEYPELECLPGESVFNVTGIQHLHDSAESGADHELSAKPEASSRRNKKLDPEKQATDQGWEHMYSDCVGSLSALRSETDVMSMDLNDRLGDDTRVPDVRVLAISDLRDSTVDFQTRLLAEQQRAKEDLLERAEKLAKVNDDAVEPQEGGENPERTESDTSIELNIPGAFN